MKAYRAERKWGYKVEEMEITGETAMFVILPSGRREKKTGEYYFWFAGLSEALAYQVKRAKGNLEASKRETNRINTELHQLEKRLRMAEAMK